MVAEVYSRGHGYRSPSLYQIRQQKKKALQSYKQISKIKGKSEKESERKQKEAEQLLQFITSSSDNGK